MTIETEEQAHSRTLADLIVWVQALAFARPEVAAELPSIYALRAAKMYIEEKNKGRYSTIKPIIDRLEKQDASESDERWKTSTIRLTKSGKPDGRALRYKAQAEQGVKAGATRKWSAAQRAAFAKTMAKKRKAEGRAQASRARVKKISKKGK